MLNHGRIMQARGTGENEAVVDILHLAKPLMFS
jgi:hypothetical protein